MKLQNDEIMSFISCKSNMNKYDFITEGEQVEVNSAENPERMEKRGCYENCMKNCGQVPIFLPLTILNIYCVRFLSICSQLMTCSVVAVHDRG